LIFVNSSLTIEDGIYPIPQILHIYYTTPVCQKTYNDFYSFPSLYKQRDFYINEMSSDCLIQDK